VFWSIKIIFMISYTLSIYVYWNFPHNCSLEVDKNEDGMKCWQLLLGFFPLGNSNLLENGGNLFLS
jgi:hypothetical protein